MAKEFVLSNGVLAIVNNIKWGDVVATHSCGDSANMILTKIIIKVVTFDGRYKSISEVLAMDYVALSPVVTDVSEQLIAIVKNSSNKPKTQGE